MNKVTVSQEASDRKRNLLMPQKMGFLAPNKNSHRSFYHLDLDGPFALGC